MGRRYNKHHRHVNKHSEKQFTVMSEKLITSDSGESFSTGDSFTYQGSDAVMSVWDNDRGLSGDSRRNERGNDRSQAGTLTNSEGAAAAGNVYAEAFYVLCGSDGRYYFMIEIEGTQMSNDEAQDDVFSFFGRVPPTGVELTAVYKGNVTGSLSYSHLGGGALFVPIEAVNDVVGLDQNADGSATLLNLLANDEVGTADGLAIKDVNGDASLLGVWVDLDDGGRVLVAANGDLQFDAGGDFDALGAGESATVTLTYTVTDNGDQSEQATVTITIDGVNDGPVTVADSATTNDAAGEIGFNLLDNDSDIDTNDVLSVTSFDVSTVQGTIDIAAGGTVTYNASPGLAYLNETEQATETFTYEVSDGKGGTSTETVTIIVNGTNGSPVANAVMLNPTAEVLEDARAVFAAASILAAVTDDEDSVDDMLLIGTDATSDLGVNLDMNSERGVIYHAADHLDSLAQGETVTDTFTYVASDSNGVLTQNSASVVVTGVNDAPVVASALTQTVRVDLGLQTINLLAGASDVDNGAVLNIANVTGLGAGMSIVNNALVVDTDDPAYDLAFGSSAASTITYDVVDEFGASVEQSLDLTVSNGFTFVTITPGGGGGTIITIPYIPGGGITITPGGGIITFPVFATSTAAYDDTVDGVEDTVITIATADLLANDADFGDLDNDGTVDGLTVTAVTSGTGGTAVLNGTEVEFTPDQDFNGEATFTYEIADSEGAMSSATVTVDVAPVNDAPTLTITQSALPFENAGAVQGFQMSLSDVDASENPDTIVTATISSSGNKIVTVVGGLLGVDEIGAATDTLEISGTLQEVTSALNTVIVFSNPENVGTNTISATVSDGGNGGGTALSATASLEFVLEEPHLTGSELADELSGSGVVFGAEGNDTITNAASDSSDFSFLHGGEGHDQIITGVGTQLYMFDDQGADTFVIDTGIGDQATYNGTAQIFGFEGGDSSFDRLDVSGFDLANGLNTNEEIFDALVAAGSIKQSTSPVDFGLDVVEFNLAGEVTGSNFAIRLLGTEFSSLNADDFIFV